MRCLARCVCWARAGMEALCVWRVYMSFEIVAIAAGYRLERHERLQNGIDAREDLGEGGAHQGLDRHEDEAREVA